jgi:hypothetical protein
MRESERELVEDLHTKNAPEHDAGIRDERGSARPGRRSRARWDEMHPAAELPRRQKVGEGSGKERRENGQTVQYHTHAPSDACHLKRVATPSDLPNTHRK